MSNTLDLQNIILRQFVSDDEYMRKVLPFIKPLYFEGNARHLFTILCKYAAKYNGMPTKEALNVFLLEQDLPGNTENLPEIIDSVYEKPDEVDKAWLLDATENWCQERAIYHAIMHSISIIDGKDTKLSKDAIPSILQDALAVGFDLKVGHEYLTSAEDRYDFYHEVFGRIPFDLDIFNKITGGGLRDKTVTILMAGTGVGKSLTMCHMAANNLAEGRNVLYISMEMDEYSVAERVDANLLDVAINKLPDISKNALKKQVEALGRKNDGQLFIKEYPTGTAHTGHFRALLNELKLKKKFVPEIIYIDYLNICASSRLRMGGSINSYTYVKAIAEEVRGLAKEFNLPIVTATQFNRTGSSSSDPSLEDVSESMGVNFTGDYVFALTATDELKELGQMMVKQLKNRYGDLNYYNRFVVGVNMSKMKLYDVSDNQQTLISNSGNQDFGLDSFKNKNIDKINVEV